MKSKNDANIAILVRLAKNAQRTLLTEKKFRWRSDTIVARSRGNRDGLILAARLLKGFETQARSRRVYGRQVAA